MGAWGHGSFENDDALDWVGDLEESTDEDPIRQALDSVTVDAEDYIEAPECSAALAAAEVVAALKGCSAPSFPDEITDWVKNHNALSDSNLVVKAQQAVDVVLTDSELKELWEENTEDYPKWVALLQDLRSRLS